METTRHFTATVYVVNDGAIALHDHERLGKRLPPGGHIDRDELPHEAGLREVTEEMGLEPTLLDATEPIKGAGRTLPQPRHTRLYDVNVHDGVVGHQHVDLIFYATVDSRAIDPAPGETPASAWSWYDRRALKTSTLDEDTKTIGCEAIETASSDQSS
ncbi:NUDIX hydrolase [Halocatena halophila]|uniref:NUDIX hydrolase n=1 Tax=Halocatena halophila TaxID=2814576 RepID=UPI002ED43EA5